MLRKVFVVLFLVSVFFSQTAQASQMIFGFISPFFGGSPLNANYISFITGSQNRIKENYGITSEKTLLESFQEDIIRQSLSMAARKIVNQAFGEDALEAGTYNIGGYNIVVTNNAGSISVVVSDPTSGETVKMEVPYY